MNISLSKHELSILDDIVNNCKEIGFINGVDREAALKYVIYYYEAHQNLNKNINEAAWK